MLGRQWQVASSLIRNGLSNVVGNSLTYVVDGRGWSIRQDGLEITGALNDLGSLHAGISYSPMGVRGQIIHFGSVGTFFRNDFSESIHPSNSAVLTWFHVAPGDPRLKQVRHAQVFFKFIHTSCLTTKKTLIAAGVNESKIRVIPLGVNTNLFRPVNAKSRSSVRERLGVPQNRFVVGSFQKDGEGWGEGLKPKYVKGPDVFVETMIKVKHLKPLVLLTGPSRGYVKKRLEAEKIEYKHLYVKDFAELSCLYHALDMYLISSRVEGGPKAILEAWASGIPVVSTKVGMVADICVNKEDVLLADSEDVSLLSRHIEQLVENIDQRSSLSRAGLNRVQDFTWSSVAMRYYNELYAPLL